MLAMLLQRKMEILNQLETMVGKQQQQQPQQQQQQQQHQLASSQIKTVRKCIILIYIYIKHLLKFIYDIFNDLVITSYILFLEL